MRGGCPPEKDYLILKWVGAHKENIICYVLNRMKVKSVE